MVYTRGVHLTHFIKMGFFFRKKSAPPQDELLRPGFKLRTWKERFEQFEREELERPDYTKHPAVDAELNRRRYTVEKDLTPEVLEEDRKFVNDLLNSSTFDFLRRCQQKHRERNERAIKRNSRPYRPEDAELWKSLPHVPGPNGLPMPRMAIKTKAQAQRTFWDFFKQFHFGLWGYRQRPYPQEKPMDIQQVLGFKWLDKRYADFVMKSGGWYYKDRLGRTRGPMELVNLKTAWAAGIVDKNTFIWGDDMDEWAPISMVYGLEPCIATPDMKLAAIGSDFVHRLARGISLWGPRKGHEKKTYKQLQAEGMEKKEREKAVLRLNNDVWPGERAPSHSLFLWAGGSELTSILEEDDKILPDKFIPYHVRKRLAQEIPGLRPWEVLDIEQLMDFMTYSGRWYRGDLGSFTTRADYEKEWFEDFKEKWDGLYEDFQDVFSKTDKKEFIQNYRRLTKKYK